METLPPGPAAECGRCNGQLSLRNGDGPGAGNRSELLQRLRTDRLGPTKLSSIEAEDVRNLDIDAPSTGAEAKTADRWRGIPLGNPAEPSTGREVPGWADGRGR